eukprot:CAMPEP_0119264458 /NCGR_PEP_ID=MMETSP1329-20130426/3533_1 /TAXON_ID=114041 /ORGANISM="Genus nov. species nov., Strain RCC1024" /LENGTH=240 /DNA_ID=CAMNT_0007264227 /DNA_START=88 /DNA_END=808 /DNA_ORIENTATION=-
MEGLASAAAKSIPATSPALSLLRVVVTNVLREPENPKYKSIKLSGKAGQKLQAEPAAMSVLTMCGFRPVGDDLVVTDFQSACAAAAAAALTPAAPAAPRPAPQLNADGTPKVVVKEAAPAQLSLKQQARRDAEERAARDKAEAKRLREETKKQIERDNHARKHDPNWKTTEGVTKGGKDINTFRGKYGEEAEDEARRSPLPGGARRRDMTAARFLVDRAARPPVERRLSASTARRREDEA